MEWEEALRSLDRLVGTWKASDPSGGGGISGQTRYEWMKGGRVMLQWVEFGDANGLEVIAFDKKTQSLRSRYYDASGWALEYVYKIEGDEMIVSIDSDGRKGAFVGQFGPNDASLKGEWNWTENGRKLSYQSLIERVT